MPNSVLSPGILASRFTGRLDGRFARVQRRGRALGLYLQHLVMLPWALLFVLLMRLLRPVLLIRLHHVLGSRLGHFAANVELYLCEREAGINVPDRPYLDIAFFHGTPSNVQLKRMWRRVFRIWPEWLVEPVHRVNRRIPGGAVHEVGNNTQHDRDVHNLLERIPPHLSFTAEEEERGEVALRRMGIPEGADFICLIGRDSAYLRSLAGGASSFEYHNYRDVRISNYVLAAETLGDRGCYVIRMGSVVAEPLVSAHSKVIDYATNGMRSDFLDIYLPAKCLFCVSCATGLDAIALVFRRPIAYVNLVPIGHWFTFVNGSVAVFKRHHLLSENRELSLREIVDRGLAYAQRAKLFADADVELVENTPEEIRGLALEMYGRLKGEHIANPDEDALQRRFWERYPLDTINPANGERMHGAIRARCGSDFLRENPQWLA